MIAVDYLGHDERFAAAIAALGAGPVRTRRFLDGFEPSTAWGALAAGRHPADPGRVFQTKALPSLVESVEAACARRQVGVLVFGGAGYPAVLAADAEAPGVLFSLGDPSVLETGARVAIVGTRSATPYGLGVASELGRGLAEAGVVVVSGLAPGIDTAAHAGALACGTGGAPVAVIGTAPDARVRQAEGQLREAVAARGAVLSERAPGSSGTPVWCFAVRNRIMAALAHVVVVVECHRQGASLQIVKAAADRGVAVAAVPGSVRSASSLGCNALLVDGVAPVRDVDDVLAVLELEIAGRPGIVPPRASRHQAPNNETTAAPGPLAARALGALDADPVSLETVVRRSGLPLADVAEALEELVSVGLVVGAGGWWSRSR